MMMSNYHASNVSVITTPEPLDSGVDVPCTQPEPLDSGVDVPFNQSFLSYMIEIALQKEDEIRSKLNLWYQLNFVGLTKPELIRTHAEQLEPYMPTIRYGEADHPGPVYDLSKIIRFYEIMVIESFG
jgi:hypothetical protein